MRDNSQRARVAVVLIFIVMAIALINIISGIRYISVLQSFIDGEDSLENYAEFVPGEVLNSIAAIAYFIALVISSITFIQWFRRAYYNIGTISPTEFTEGWAAGAWFVPILNWFRPYRIMAEINRKAYNLLENKGISERKNNQTLIGIWWALWVVGNILNQIAFRFPSDTLEDLQTSTYIENITYLMDIPMGLIICKVIKDYSKMEKHLYSLDDTAVETDLSDFDDILDAGL